MRFSGITIDYAGTASFIVLMAAALEAVRRILRVLRRLSVQADAFLGTPEVGDVPARPGLLERAESHEHRLDRVETAIAGFADLQAQVVDLQKKMTQLLAASESRSKIVGRR